MVIAELEPLAGIGYEFVDKVVGGAIPREFIQPINNGIMESLKMASCWMDFKATSLFDGSSTMLTHQKWHFKIAGSMAFRDIQ